MSPPWTSSISGREANDLRLAPRGPASPGGRDLCKAMQMWSILRASAKSWLISQGALDRRLDGAYPGWSSGTQKAHDWRTSLGHDRRMCGHPESVSTEEIDHTIATLRWLTPFEKSVSRGRLVLFSQGRMPRWEKQVARTGLESMGYIVLAAMWVPVLAVFGIVAALLTAPHHLSPPLVVMQLVFGILAIATLCLCVTRQAQGMRAGERYKESQRTNETGRP